MASVQVRDVTKRYRHGQPGEVRALDGVSLTIQASEFVSFLGRSGSGKTTLLHAIGLLVRPTSGQVVLDGMDTGGLGDGQRADLRGRRIGFVLRDPSLLPDLTVVENVMLPLRYARIARGGRRRALELLGAVGLADEAGHRPDRLAPGQAQRVAIARALIKAPTLVLADEPTGEVDSETGDELLYLMQQLTRASGATFVVATHDPDVATCMDRVVRIRDGQLVSDERQRGAGSPPAVAPVAPAPGVEIPMARFRLSG